MSPSILLVAAEWRPKRLIGIAAVVGRPSGTTRPISAGRDPGVRSAHPWLHSVAAPRLSVVARRLPQVVSQVVVFPSEKGRSFADRIPSTGDTRRPAPS